MSTSWEDNRQYLAQVGHFFGAYAIVFTVGVFFGTHPMAWTFGAGIAIAAVKEFVMDVAPTSKWYGEGDSWSDSAMDFTFYVIGGLAGLGMLTLWHHVLT